jgi:hypothetical protein
VMGVSDTARQHHQTHARGVDLRSHSLPSRRRSEWRGWRTRRRISSSASVTSGESHAAPRTRPPRVSPRSLTPTDRARRKAHRRYDP